MARRWVCVTGRTVGGVDEMSGRKGGKLLYTLLYSFCRLPHLRYSFHYITVIQHFLESAEEASSDLRPGHVVGERVGRGVSDDSAQAHPLRGPRLFGAENYNAANAYSYLPLSRLDGSIPHPFYGSLRCHLLVGSPFVSVAYRLMTWMTPRRPCRQHSSVWTKGRGFKGSRTHSRGRKHRRT